MAEGIEAALGRREQVNRRPKKLDGSGEAHLVALACGAPPEGRADTLKLLADRLVECEIVESISYETVRQTLKPWLKEFDFTPKITRRQRASMIMFRRCNTQVVLVDEYAHKDRIAGDGQPEHPPSVIVYEAFDPTEARRMPNGWRFTTRPSMAVG